ncbi:PBSX family phage terminase large subunit [Paenibacillus hunanensis]|uniref:PBSX family phage terminase large subunit n=1 Tax=Paenibacillus hunanensis TaxID=539262 RepID=A0ABU1IV59_9BACL|nr:PBSX family phage terminase large subunit [Paenibacillus hunanensis]MDR6243159.1 PBSX family phage terminase large subunit [Paenibacillus hunanensis]GGJ11371.1 phage terminase large subunit [Paenibacillus hunanensis]
MRIKRPKFNWRPFSHKQKQILTWWNENSAVKDKEGIIADGAIRSGKTVSMSFSYVMWAMETFRGQNFGMAGKTIGSFRRNVLFWLKLMLVSRGYKVKDARADNMVTVTKKGVENYFYIFGGKDERSQDLIQGITLAGMFFDEVALMPASFVNQATGRCSVDGSKFWFNCNPDGPYHWFKTEWIDKVKEKQLLHLHFTMDDNLSLSERIKERYRSMYSGVFYKRYILGLWAMAEGVIYDMFDEVQNVIQTGMLPTSFPKYYVGVDYGHTNATVFLLFGQLDNKLYLIKEYYHSGADASGEARAPSDYARDFVEFIAGFDVKKIFIDPSAKGFITELKKMGVRRIEEADNAVLPGIESVAVALKEQQLFVSALCTETIKEFFSYIWDVKASQRGDDKPIKQNDHAMDALRYVIYNLLGKPRRSKFIV